MPLLDALSSGSGLDVGMAGRLSNLVFLSSPDQWLQCSCSLFEAHAQIVTAGLKPSPSLNSLSASL